MQAIGCEGVKMRTRSQEEVNIEVWHSGKATAEETAHTTGTNNRNAIAL